MCVVVLGLSRSSYVCGTPLGPMRGFGVFGANEVLNDSWCVFKMSEGIRS